MKKHLFAFFIIFAIVSMVVSGCGEDHTPQPAPEMFFEVQGQKILVKGQMKPGAKVSAAEMKAAILTAVRQLESR